MLILFAVTCLMLTHAMAQTTALKTEKDSLSYGFGSLIAQNLTSQGVTGLSAMQISGGLNAELTGTNKFLDVATAGKCVNDFMGAKFAGKNPIANMDSISYGLGVLIAQNLKSQGFTDLDATQLAQGLDDAFQNKAAMTPEAANALISRYSAAQAEKKFGNNKAEGAAFLAENAKRPEVKTTASGLQYQILKDGTGESPKLTDKVKTHYHGTLINGTVFDSSVERGEPIEFPVNGVIPGWTEALQLMKVGSKWKLFIPYNLAYGERGAGANIGPFSTLVFEVELLKVN